jgi:hypothetical protein
VVAAVVVAVTVGVLVVQSLADARGCDGSSAVRLPVAADPAIAPAVRDVADEWTASEEPVVDGRCVAVDVTAAATAEVASALATSAGGVVDVGRSSPAPEASRAGDVPAVWVPDSSYWLARLRTVSRTFFEPDPVPLATSPIVLAASPAGAELIGGGAAVPPGALREPVLAALAGQQPVPVALAEPRRDTAGLVGAGWLEQAVVATDPELPNLVATFRQLDDAPPDTAAALARVGEAPVLVPASEQAVTTHNRAGPTPPVTPVPVAGAPSLDFPYAVLARQPRDIQTAASQFRAALAGATGVFARHGFRPADAVDPVGSGAEQAGQVGQVGAPERLTRTLRIWTSATRDARVLSVVNVNASMNTPMSTSDGSLIPRVEVFRATALAGMPLFTAGTALGHWEYAVGLDSDRDWVEGVPIATLTPEHRQAVEQAVRSVQPVATNQAAMFETLLAAYREMQEGYDPTRSNTLIMWTDSGGTKAGGLTLAETLTELERTADVTRPIRVILLGLGPDADLVQLEAIADTTGGGAFHLTDPDEIALVFLRALLT